MDIYYEHDKRKIVDQEGNEHSYEDAVDGMIAGQFTDCNTAMSTLINHDGDMDAVEKYYVECEKYK